MKHSNPDIEKSKASDGNINVGSSHDEDPVEAYKREFQRKRFEKEKDARKRQIRAERKIFKFVHTITLPILAFAMFLIVDDLLPSNVYHEVAEMGWQESAGKGVRKVYTTYMQTASFVVAVPAELHLDYPYYEQHKEALTIRASSMLNIPQTIEVVINGNLYQTDALYTIYSMFIPLHYLLFISALFTVARKNYSKLNYSLCFLPALILCFVILKMM
jgi:hypothetical protein